MKIYLQTRGVAHDYAFLGEAPSDYWWAVPFYKDATSFEQPSLILEYGKPRAGEWQCFISAIPSGRRDCVNTRIRYSIALSGDGEADTDVLRKLLASVLDIFSKNPVSEDNSLTRLLDAEVGVHADEWLGVNAEQEQIRDHINGLTAGFDKLEPCPDSGELSKLYNQLQGLLTNAQNSPRRAAILNFIGDEDDPSAKHLQSQAEASDGKILIFPSPVAGGRLGKFFVLEGNSPKIITNHIRPLADESEAEVSAARGDRPQKGRVDAVKKVGVDLLDQLKAEVGSVYQSRPCRSSGKTPKNRDKLQSSSPQDDVFKSQPPIAGEDSSETFRVGSQGDNQTTEGHNIMGSSFGTSDVRSSRNGIVLMVAVTIIVALLVVAGCYLAQN